MVKSSDLRGKFEKTTKNNVSIANPLTIDTLKFIAKIGLWHCDSDTHPTSDSH